MSVNSGMADLKAEHANLRGHFTPSQNRELDEMSKSAARWRTAGLGAYALMALALLALWLS